MLAIIVSKCLYTLIKKVRFTWVVGRPCQLCWPSFNPMLYIKDVTVYKSYIAKPRHGYIGMRELCANNFGNNDGTKELSIIAEF